MGFNCRSEIGYGTPFSASSSLVGLTKIVFFRHNIHPGALLPLPLGEGTKNLLQKTLGGRI
jgi:hypothetical protein